MLPVVALLVTAVGPVGCASDDEVTSDDAASDSGEDELTAAAKTTCGPGKYQQALPKYELAVRAAKAMAAQKMSCITVKDPKNSNAEIEASEDAVAGLLLEAVNTCGEFHKVYTQSVYAKPVRDLLAKSLITSVLDGSLAGPSFKDLAAKLPGKTLYGPTPGVLRSFDVTFAAGGKATWRSYGFSDDGDVTTTTTNVTWKVITGTTPKLEITSGGKKTTYPVSLDGSGILFGTLESGSYFGSFRDDCSA